MEKIVAIFNAGDLLDVDLIFSPDSIDHQRPPDMEINGPDEFRQIVMNIGQSAQDLKVTIEDLIGERDKVAGRLRWHIVDSAGTEISRETIDILRFEDGQVIERWGAET